MLTPIEKRGAMTGYRGRLAPSPTGLLHLGHARTCLVAWLRARDAGGTLVLRVEDLDPPRVVRGAADALRRDLEWLGLDWDEGDDDASPVGPYSQSSRSEHYEAALAALRADGWVYPCTCSRREIAAVASAPHGAEELGRRYPGTCRRRPPRTDRPAALRFRMPEPPEGFDDEALGWVDGAAWGGDFILRRSDGPWSYQLAVVVDDAAMRISEVVRGADLLSSTPRQLALYRALNKSAPAFLHVPLVLTESGERLSKRDGSESLHLLRESGLAPEAVIGSLAASLGLAPGGVALRPHELLGTLELSSLAAAEGRVRISR